MNTMAIGGGSSRGGRNYLGAAPLQSNSHQQYQQQQFTSMSDDDDDDDDGTYEYNVDEMALKINHEGRTGTDDDREYVSDGNYTMNSSGVSSGRGGGVVLTQHQRRYGVPASSLSTPSSAIPMNKPPTSSISPSYSSSTPGGSKQLTGRRKNMMQRRIEMRRRQEELPQQPPQQEEKNIRMTQQTSQQPPPQMRLIRGLSLSSQSQSQMQYPRSRQPQHSNNKYYMKNDNDDDEDGEYSGNFTSSINYFSQYMSHPSQQQQQQQQQQNNSYPKNHPKERQSPLIMQQQQNQDNKQYQFHNVHHQKQQQQQQQQQHTRQQKILQHQSQHQYSIEQQQHQRQTKYYSKELCTPNHNILSPPILQRTGDCQNNHIVDDMSREGGRSGEDDVVVQQHHVRFSFDGDDEEEDDDIETNYHDDIYYNSPSLSAVDRRINTNNIGVLNNVAGVNDQLRMLSQNNQYLHRQQKQEYRQQSQQLATQHQNPRSKSEPRHQSSQQHHPLQNKQSPSSNSVASIRKKWQDKMKISTNLQHQEVYQREEQYQCKQRDNIYEQQYQEQRGKNNIEDRWLNNRRRNTVNERVLLPLEKYGNKSQQQVVERRSISAPRSDKYDEDSVLQQYPDAITPQDAKRMLWDENERLLAVLPKHERMKLNDVRGRWLEHKTDDEMEKHRIIQKSPSNTSQSSRRFKTKYLHAAFLAQQKSCDSDDIHFSQQQQQQPQREVNISSRHLRSISQQHQQQQHQQHHQRQQQQYAILHKKKNSPVSSHFTDSTTETTADIMSTPDGSSNVSSPRNRAATSQNNSSSVLSNKLTPSPPKRLIGGGIHHTTRDSSLAMPPIDEQAVVSLPTLQQQQSQTTSVANLIARINAVSRSDPQKALAAIDSIIKKESGGIVYGTDHQPNVVIRHHHRCMNAPRSSSIAPQETLQSVPIVRRIVDDHRIGTSSGLGIRVPANAPLVPIVGNYALNREKSFCSLAAILPDEREGDGEFGNDDNDDSLLSSNESTVSSMTNPTYQSNLAQNASTKQKVMPSAVISAATTNLTIRPKPRTPPVSTTFQSKRDPPPIMSEQSWDVIKQKCTAVKAPTTYSIDNNSPDDELYGRLTPSHIVKDLEQMSDSHALEMSAWIPIPQNGDIFNNNTQKTPRPADIPPLRTQIGRAMTNDDRLLDRILDTTYSSRSVHQQWNVVPAEIPPLQSLQSDADTFETPLPTIHHHKQQQPITPCTASLPEEIAKAFSDVDISFHEQQQQGNSRTANERKKQLEKLSTTWVDNYNNTHATMNDTTNSSQKQSTSIASSSNKSNKSSDFAGKLREKIKKVEPPIRLKGNRSLSQKFANLVNAFE